jgi:hypothetical protein
VTDLEDPALRQLLARPDDPTRGHTTLPVQGRAWIGGKRSIQVDVGEPLTLVLAAPRDELVAEARGLAQWQLLIGLGILGLTLGLVWLSARRISRPLETLARSVERIGEGTSIPRSRGVNPLEVGAPGTTTGCAACPGHIEERAARLAEYSGGPGSRHRAPDPAVDAPHRTIGAAGAATRSPRRSSQPAR